MVPGNKVKYVGGNHHQGDKNEVGVIARVEINVSGQQVYIVECVDENLWTDHGRGVTIEKRWPAKNCEAIDETR